MSTRYQETIDKARGFDQLSSAMKQGWVPSPHEPMPENESYLRVLRAKAANAVYSIWNESQGPATLGQIYSRVQANIAWDKGWPIEWASPSKRTVDRRVNEAADPRFYEGSTPIIAIKAGSYCPNPVRFEGRARTLLSALVA